MYAGQGSQLYEGGTPTGLYRAGDGSILVSGAGSTFDIVPGSSGAGDLVLGGGGTGTVTVQDGGGMTIAGTAAVGGDHAGTLAVRSGGSIASRKGSASVAPAARNTVRRERVFPGIDLLILPVDSSVVIVRLPSVLPARGPSAGLCPRVSSGSEPYGSIVGSPRATEPSNHRA